MPKVLNARVEKIDPAGNARLVPKSFDNRVPGALKTRVKNINRKKNCLVPKSFGKRVPEDPKAGVEKIKRKTEDILSGLDGKVEDDDLYFALFTLNLHYICRSKL